MEAMSDRIARENPAKNNIVVKSVEMLVATIAYNLAMDFIRKLRESKDEQRAALGEHLDKLGGPWKAYEVKSEKKAEKLRAKAAKEGISCHRFGNAICFPASEQDKMGEFVKSKDIVKEFGQDLADPLGRTVVSVACKSEKAADALVGELKAAGIEAARTGADVICKPTQEEWAKTTELIDRSGSTVRSAERLSPSEKLEDIDRGLSRAAAEPGINYELIARQMASQPAPEGATGRETEAREQLRGLIEAKDAEEAAREAHNGVKEELKAALDAGDEDRISALTAREADARKALGAAEAKVGERQASYDASVLELAGERQAMESLKPKELRSAEALAANLAAQQGRANYNTRADRELSTLAHYFKGDAPAKGREAHDKAQDRDSQDVSPKPNEGPSVSAEEAGKPASERQLGYLRELEAKGAVSADDIRGLGDSPTKAQASELISRGEDRLAKGPDGPAKADGRPSGPDIASETMAAERREDIGNNQTTADYVQSRPNSNDSDRSTPWSDGEDAPGQGDTNGDGVMDSAEDIDGDAVPDSEDPDQSEREQDQRNYDDPDFRVADGSDEDERKKKGNYGGDGDGAGGSAGAGPGSASEIISTAKSASEVANSLRESEQKDHAPMAR